MKVTRLRRGFVIRLSDSDFDLIAALVDDGECRTVHESESDNALSDAGYSPAIQASYTRRTQGRGLNLMRIDEDRR